MRIDVITIFPDYLNPLREALLGKAIERNQIAVEVHDLRKWTHDVHKAVDDSPYGGGPGMVMKPQVWGEALDEVCSADPVTGGSAAGAETPSAETPSAETPSAETPRLVVPTPAGRPFTQHTAQRWSHESWLLFACGRYEGIDQRVVDDAARRMPVEEVSIGDYVLVGGEVAALTMIEAVARLLPGVLGNPASAEQDSFSEGLLEGPCYTRPEVWRDLPVPDVLRSGNHAAIARWRRDEALRRTHERRPDLLDALPEDAIDAKDRRRLDTLRDSEGPGGVTK